MRLFYITGSSSGLGEAIAQLLLEEENNRVVGIARRQSITHDRYTHISMDLSQPIAVNVFDPLPVDCEQVVLINNAGALGPVTQVGSQSYAEVSDVYALNLTAPSFLCNQFVKAFANSHVKKVIVNVSSGAGKHPIAGWSTYCASKAALDLFSEVLQAEHPAFHVFSLAPGIVDTAMQASIRQADEEHFPLLQQFHDYKADGDLASPREVATKYLMVIEKAKNFQQVVHSVRDL